MHEILELDCGQQSSTEVQLSPSLWQVRQIAVPGRPSNGSSSQAGKRLFGSAPQQFAVAPQVPPVGTHWQTLLRQIADGFPQQSPVTLQLAPVPRQLVQNLLPGGEPSGWVPAGSEKQTEVGRPQQSPLREQTWLSALQVQRLS